MNMSQLTEKSQLRTDIEMAINRNSAENGSDTPDFILAVYLLNCLEAFDKAVHARSAWYSHHCTICTNCRKPYSLYGCQEGVCHAPPKMPDDVKREILKIIGKEENGNETELKE